MSLKKRLLSSSRLSKKLIVAFCDFLSICIATFFALYISDFDFQLLTLEHALRFSFIPFFCLVVFWYSGVYSSVVRYIDFSVIYIISKGHYKKESSIKDFIFDYFELFLVNNKTRYFNHYNHFVKGYDNVKKFNLDEDTFFLEYKQKILYV